MKKIILTVFAATSLLLYSTPSFAFSISVGVPVGSTITGEKPAGWTTNYKSEGVSGYFLGVQLPFSVGLGLDSYKTNLEVSPGESELKLATSMYNLYYQLPVPVINLIIGIGTGKHTMECATCKEGYMGSSSYDSNDDGTKDTTSSSQAGYKSGSVSQWYASIGMPIMPLFDIHLSYRSITSKKVVYQANSNKLDLSSNVTGIGFAFNF